MKPEKDASGKSDVRSADFICTRIKINNNKKLLLSLPKKDECIHTNKATHQIMNEQSSEYSYGKFTVLGYRKMLVSEHSSFTCSDSATEKRDKK